MPAIERNQHIHGIYGPTRRRNEAMHCGQDTLGCKNGAHAFPLPLFPKP